MEERRSTGLEMITVGRDRVSRSMLAGTALPVRPKQSIHLYRYFNTMLPPLI